MKHTSMNRSLMRSYINDPLRCVCLFRRRSVNVLSPALDKTDRYRNIDFRTLIQHIMFLTISLLICLHSSLYICPSSKEGSPEGPKHKQIQSSSFPCSKSIWTLKTTRLPYQLSLIFYYSSWLRRRRPRHKKYAW